MGLIKSQMKPASAILLLSANFGLGSIASYKSCEYASYKCVYSLLQLQGSDQGSWFGKRKSSQSIGYPSEGFLLFF